MLSLVCFLILDVRSIITRRQNVGCALGGMGLVYWPTADLDLVSQRHPEGMGADHMHSVVDLDLSIVPTIGHGRQCVRMLSSADPGK